MMMLSAPSVHKVEKSIGERDSSSSEESEGATQQDAFDLNLQGGTLLFHVNSVDLTRRRTDKKSGLSLWEDEEGDEESSGRVRFSDMPIEIIQVTLPFEKEAQERNETRLEPAVAIATSQDNNTSSRPRATPSATETDFTLLPVKRTSEGKPKNEDGEEKSPTKRPKIPNEP